jgi:hypothetical protein
MNVDVNNFKIVSKKYIHSITNECNDIEIDLIQNQKEYNIYIVYYINCLCNENYLDWLNNQIKIVEPLNSKIYIIATLNKNDEQGFLNHCYKNFNNCEVECNYENNHEYPGILKAWILGQTYNKTNDIILYFHSKGITHNQHYVPNENLCSMLKDIDKIKEIFTIFPKIDKIGMNSGGIGWIWYNFWYARGSYINKVEKPIKTSRRHYYEDWISRKIINDNYVYTNDDVEKSLNCYDNTLHSCYSLYTNNSTIANIGTYFCPNTGRFYNYSMPHDTR